LVRSGTGCDGSNLPSGQRDHRRMTAKLTANRSH
jgi:hypothetical protein